VGVPGRSLIVRLVMRQTSGSTAGDPLSPSIVGTLKASCWLMPDVSLLDPTIVNRVMPSGVPVKHPRSTVVNGV
jgi:hypothetical protein